MILRALPPDPEPGPREPADVGRMVLGLTDARALGVRIVWSASGPILRPDVAGLAWPAHAPYALGQARALVVLDVPAAVAGRIVRALGPDGELADVLAEGVRVGPAPESPAGPDVGGDFSTSRGPEGRGP